MDEIVIFQPLSGDDLRKISSLALDELRCRAESVGIELDFSEKIIETVANTNETKKFGARPIKRKASELIENRLAQMIVDSKILKGDSVKADIVNGEITITKTVAV